MDFVQPSGKIAAAWRRCAMTPYLFALADAPITTSGFRAGVGRDHRRLRERARTRTGSMCARYASRSDPEEESEQEADYVLPGSRGQCDRRVTLDATSSASEALVGFTKPRAIPVIGANSQGSQPMNSGLENGVRSTRVGPWMGIAFFVLFVVGFLAISTPMDNESAIKWQRWWTDSGHRVSAIIGAYLIVLGLLAFVWFMWDLNQRFRDGSGMMITFGSLFVALALVAVLARVAVPGGKVFGGAPVPAGDFARQFDNLGQALMLVPGALAAGAFAATASHLARRDAILPGWLTVAGYVVAVLQLAAGLFLPFVLFLLWVLVVSIVLLRRTSRVDTPVPAAPSS
jgi:hypothetical protein